MRRNTILIISILAMLLLAGSLMGLQIHIDTNYDGQAYLEISTNGILIERIPPHGIFFIEENSSNTQILSGLNNSYGYTATVYAHRYVNGVIIRDIDSQNFTYETGSITLTVDLSGNGSIPDDPPAGH
ncbi:MAG: hypothetical protein P9L95_09680 [Candidatus Tenebribacter mawsonii]|nr:hypothetical protein [Candidatus Tenebribacter mawsonii]